MKSEWPVPSNSRETGKGLKEGSKIISELEISVDIKFDTERTYVTQTMVLHYMSKRTLHRLH